MNDATNFAPGDVWGTPISNQAFFKYDSDPLRLLSDVLYRTHLQNVYSSSVSAITRVDAKGNANREEWVELTPNSSISHILYELYIDKPGIINLQDAYEIGKNNKRVPISWAVYATGPTTLASFLVFKRVLRPKERIRYYTSIHAQNYFSNLPETGRERYPFGLNKGASVTGLNETYMFPNIKIYRELKACMLSHPVKKLQGKEFRPQRKGDHLVINIPCSVPANIDSKNTEILIDFSL